MAVKTVMAPDVKRPATVALGSSVLDHSTVAEVSNFGLRHSDGLWPSYNTTHARTEISVPCLNPGIPEVKTFDEVPWVEATEFAIYAGVQCRTVGLDTADQKAEIARVFAANEGKAVEEHLLANALTAATDLTPGSPVGLLVALALVEGHAANNYAGVPTLHMPRAAATILEGHGLIAWQGNKAYTINGSKVAIGGGYDDPTMLASGEWMIYATGEVYVEKSDLVHEQQNVVPGDGSGVGSDENGLADNTVVTLVERMFRVGVDVVLGKAKGTVWT